MRRQILVRYSIFSIQHYSSFLSRDYPETTQTCLIKKESGGEEMYKWAE